MHASASSGDVEALEALHRLGLSIESQDRFGKTPLMEATLLEAVEWLLKHGANPNATAKDGCTVLHEVYIGIMSAGGDFDEEGKSWVALLEKYGADPTIRDEKGRTPKDFLKRR